MRLSGLGTPVPNGPVMSRVGPASMVPGACCYDSQRVWWWPSWIVTDAEAKCIQDTDGCRIGMTVGPPPVAALPCATANPDGTCATSVPSVNDSKGTADQLVQGQKTNEQLMAEYYQGVKDSAVGLTPGGCPNGQEGTYPDCGNCAWYQSGTYPACDAGMSGLGIVAIAALGLFFVGGFIQGRR
jgi:hypothetical protein